ncbi:hypothetical protein ACFL6S_20610, partial [Candidatus Poribacteria bacterium]
AQDRHPHEEELLISNNVYYRYADNRKLFDTDFSTTRAAILHCANRRDKTKKARYYKERMRKT